MLNTSSGIRSVGLIVLLLAVTVFAQTAVKAPPASGGEEWSPKKFVGVQCADSCVVTVVLKATTPESVAKSIHSAFVGSFSRQVEVATVGGKRIQVREVFVSNLVRDAKGRWVFKVYGRPAEVNATLAKYRDYVEGVLVKVKPDLMVKGLGVDLNVRNVTPFNFQIRNLLGVPSVESVYGVTGAGVRVAVVDTGVDYGHPDLRDALNYWSGVYKGLSVREPLVFDADESQVLMMQDVYKVNSTHIYVGGRWYTTYVPYPLYIYPPCDYYRIPSWLASLQEPYKFGLTYMNVPGRGLVVVGVLMYKPSWAPDKYYGAIVDANGNCRFDDEPYGGSWFTYYMSRIVAPDYNRNGYPDVSMGVLGGFFLDWWWNFGYPAEIFPGWDPQGRWLSIFYDSNSHGTACASAIAGRGVVAYNVPGFGTVRLYGIARGAKIVGVKALEWDNVEAGMLWAAGFDIDPSTGSWKWTGQKRAHVISNSWGISSFIYDVAGFGFDLESVFVEGLSTPGFLDPSYPGIVIVQAGGNGGHGYGTITSPGVALSALTVGASTSTHFAYAYSMLGGSALQLWSSGGGWRADEIISWSLRGPAPAGYNKPDVVNVGAFGFTAAPVALNYTTFGGTSYATPLTAGVVALVLQVLGVNADPALVKTVVMSSADHLWGYDPASQGAGRVNAFRAVSLARLLKGQSSARYELRFFSSSAYSSMAPKLGNIWYWQWCDNIRAYMLWWVGADLPLSSCSLPSGWSNRVSTSVFVADVPQGGSKSFSFTIQNPTNKTVRVSNIYTMTLRPVATQTFDFRLSIAPYASYNRTRIVITASNVTNANFLEAVASIPFEYMDVDLDYNLDLRVRVWIHLWLNDTNGNGVPDPEEMALVNYGYNYYDVNIATMRGPRTNAITYRGIVITVDLVRGADYYPYGSSVPPIPVRLTLRYYSFDSDRRISFSTTSGNIPPGGTLTVSGSVRASASDVPTYYGGFIVVATNITTYVIPYSYNIYTTISDVFKLLSGSTGTFYNASSVRGANDWAWRYEAGDWRVYYVAPPSNAWAIEVHANWTNLRTSLAIYTLGPDGQFAGAFVGQGASWGAVDYLGGGVFAWVANPVGAMDGYLDTRAVAFPAVNYRAWLYPTSKPNAGVFTVLVRTTNYAGLGAEEPIYVKVRALPLASGLPAQSVGSVSAAIRFSLPYIVDRIYANAVRPATPLLDFDQSYAQGWASISPWSVYGPYPANTQFTFYFNAYNYGAPGQRIDFSALFSVKIPSLKVYERWIGGTYNLITDYYLFEDWTRVVK